MCYVGVKKKLEVLAKQKDCDTVRLWNASIISHMYWSTTTSGGNGDLTLAKWKSISRHIQNKHDDHGKLFRRCEHGPIGKKKWLKPSKHPCEFSMFHYELHFYLCFIFILPLFC